MLKNICYNRREVKYAFTLLFLALIFALAGCEAVNTQVAYTQDLGFAKTLPTIEEYFPDAVIEVLDSDGGEAYVYQFSLTSGSALSDEQILAFVGKAREMGWNDDIIETATWENSGSMDYYVFLAHQTFNEVDICFIKINIENEQKALRVGVYYVGGENE